MYIQFTSCVYREAFAGGFKGNLNCVMRKIPSLGDLLKPLKSIVIRFNIITAITGGHLCSDSDGILLSLAVKFGGRGIPLFHNDAK